MTTYFKYTILNRNAILKSAECACIYCFNKFAPEEIIEWCTDVDESGVHRNDTAICPYCFIDAVIIPDSSVYYTENDLIVWRSEGFSM